MSEQSIPARATRQSYGHLPWAKGTYRIDDLASGRFYYGSAASLRKRWVDHLYRLGRGDHPNPIMQAIWNRDPDRLAFCVIEQLPEAIEAQLIAAEQALLDGAEVGRNPQCMNILAVAKSHRGRKRSLLTRQRISAALRGKNPSPEARAKMRAAKLGKPLSAEHRRKIAEKARGRPGPKHTAEMLARYRKYSPEQVAELRGLVASGVPVLAAAKRVGMARATAARIINGQSYAC